MTYVDMPDWVKRFLEKENDEYRRAIKKHFTSKPVLEMRGKVIYIVYPLEENKKVINFSERFIDLVESITLRPIPPEKRESVYDVLIQMISNPNWAIVKPKLCEISSDPLPDMEDEDKERKRAERKAEIEKIKAKRLAMLKPKAELEVGGMTTAIDPASKKKDDMVTMSQSGIIKVEKGNDITFSTRTPDKLIYNPNPSIEKPKKKVRSLVG